MHGWLGRLEGGGGQARAPESALPLLFYILASCGIITCAYRRIAMPCVQQAHLGTVEFVR